MSKNFNFTTNEQQLDYLESKGLTIENREFAAKNLSLYGYYNIINSYSDPYVQIVDGEKKYKLNTTFEQIFSLFSLDHRLRNSIISSMIDFEDHLRASASEVVAKSFGTDHREYLKQIHYRDRNESNPKFKLESVLHKMTKTVYSHKYPICYYKSRYDIVPPWVLFKGLDFGTLVNFIKHFKKEQKEMLVEQMFNITEPYNQDENIKNLLMDSLFLCYDYRNLTAHGGRVYSYQSDKHIRNLHDHPENLENYIAISDDVTSCYNIAELLFILKLFKYKGPYKIIEATLNNIINSHCNNYPDDLDCIERATGLIIDSIEVVWVNSGSSVFHKNQSCSNMNNPVAIEMNDALAKGLRPCKRCAKDIN